MSNQACEIDGFKCYAPKLAHKNDNFSAENFEKLYQIENKNFWFRSRNVVLCHLFKRFLGSSGRKEVMEIGCGTGFVLSELSKFKNFNLHGSEIYLEGLKIAKKRLPGVDLVQLDATSMPFKDEFDAVGAFDVLEHIEEDSKVIQQVHSSLKPHGFFIITVPQFEWMWSYLDDWAKHKRRYTLRDLRLKLHANGFKVVYNTSFVFVLFPFMVISRLLKGKKDETGSEEFSSELKINPRLNAILRAIMKVDEFLIKLGFSLPFGGSLVAVAQKEESI